MEGAGTLGIVPLNPSVEGVENVAFNDFTIGVDVTGERQVNNTYQWNESLSKVLGKHTFKLGANFHLDQVNINSNSINNGSFVFQGSETGLDFADYLIGVASTYEQGDASGFYIRNKYAGLFAQDSWQARSNLTLNYGVRWDMLPPWREKYNQLQTFVLGQQSEVYPGAPKGMVFPGERGQGRGGAAGDRRERRRQFQTGALGLALLVGKAAQERVRCSPGTACSTPHSRDCPLGS